MSGRSNEPLVGQLIAGRYRLTRKMGEGGMGEVYEATQEALGHTVAVKILREKYADRPEVARRLLNEAQLASSIEHENIVRILDSGSTADGRPFVVMEHLRGESLAERIRKDGAQEQPFVVRMGLQAARALAAAHARSIVHRDVKPENLILVDGGDPEEARCKIVDFGISKHMAGEASDSDLRLTATGMVLGTPLYMAPEQARGSDDIDHRVDIYSLGVILYEALTGEVPFRANNYLGVIAQVLSAEVVPPRTLRPELSITVAMNDLVLRALQRDRADRYPSMVALVEDLERIRVGRALFSDPQASANRVVEPRRGRALWPLGVGLGLGAVALLTVPRLAPHNNAPPALVVPLSAANGKTPVLDAGTHERFDAAVPSLQVLDEHVAGANAVAKHLKRAQERASPSRLRTDKNFVDGKTPPSAETLPNPY